MKKWKLLLGAIGTITPLAISTPFIVGCSSKARTLNIEPPTKFITFETFWSEFNYWDREIFLYVKIYRDEIDYNRQPFNTFQIGRKDKITKEWVWLNNGAIYEVKNYYKLALENGYTPITMYS